VVHPDKKQDSKMSDPIKTFWHNITKTEPYWSVLTNDKYKMSNIDLAKFYETGSRQVDRLISYLKSNDLISEIHTCLDFGCGVGRTTAPLSRVCNNVDGVDLSSGMIDIARDYMDENNIDNVTLADSSQNTFLPQKQKYDLIFSWAVLQHNPLPESIDLLSKLCQSISSSGIAVVWIYSKIENPSDRNLSHAMQMHDLPIDQALDVIHKNSCELLEYNTNNLSSLNKEQYEPDPESKSESGYLVIKAVA
jgi:2-polyprenyl-3-methyl-5-hydroxy-6-metoxy-1,4-benzoquinol methylase